MIDPSVMKIGKQLVKLCQQGKHLDAVNTLYSKDIVSIEPFGDENMPARMEGIDAIRGKNEWWLNAHEVHGGTARGPWPNGNQFIAHFTMDVTAKEGPTKGKRMNFEEVGLYTVKDGKIVQEQFFCDLSGMPGMG